MHNWPFGDRPAVEAYMRPRRPLGWTKDVGPPGRRGGRWNVKRRRKGEGKGRKDGEERGINSRKGSGEKKGRKSGGR